MRCAFVVVVGCSAQVWYSRVRFFDSSPSFTIVIPFATYWCMFQGSSQAQGFLHKICATPPSIMGRLASRLNLVLQPQKHNLPKWLWPRGRSGLKAILLDGGCQRCTNEGGFCKPSLNAGFMCRKVVFFWTHLDGSSCILQSWVRNLQPVFVYATCWFATIPAHFWCEKRNAKNPRTEPW